jgi:hypothetical protein
MAVLLFVTLLLVAMNTKLKDGKVQLGELTGDEKHVV